MVALSVALSVARVAPFAARSVQRGSATRRAAETSSSARCVRSTGWSLASCAGSRASARSRAPAPLAPVVSPVPRRRRLPASDVTVAVASSLADFWSCDVLFGTLARILAAAFAAFLAHAAWRRHLTDAFTPRVTPSASPRMAALIAACPSLHRALRPPLLMQTSFAQLVAYLLKRRVAPPAAWRRQTITTSDGGEIALDWYEGIHGDPTATAVAASLPRDAPVVAVMHTLTGAARDFVAFAGVAASRGFRVAVCLRRGHLDAPLRTPKFNLLGDCDDLDAHVAAIRDAFPRARVFGYAESAGTGLAVRHSGERGDASPFDATTCVCPGYDTTEGGAFSRFEPLLDRYLLASVKKMFLRDNERVWSSSSTSPSYDEMCRARSMAELQRLLYGAEGYASLEEYHANTNPMGVVTGITRPTLVINADDDPICATSNVEDNAWCFEGDVSRALVQTPVGTHCCFFEGRTIRPRSCWAHDAALEFFEAVFEERRRGAEEAAEEESAANAGEGKEATQALASGVSTTIAGRGDA